MRWSELDPGNILAQALLASAIGFHVVHVVPGGEPEASAAEVDFCRRLVATADAVGVRMHDYMIYAGQRRWRSLHRCQSLRGAVVGDEVVAAADLAARGVEAREGARRPPGIPSPRPGLAW